MNTDPKNVVIKIEQILRREVNHELSVEALEAVGGGSINRCYRVKTRHRGYFCKTNRASEIDNFKAEFRGLNLLSQNLHLDIPQPLAVGTIDDIAVLILPLIKLYPLSGQGANLLGTGLAMQHRIVCKYFGLKHDNFIGLSPQVNTPARTWSDFLKQSRFMPQLAMAKSNGCDHSLIRLGERLLDVLPRFFEEYDPVPSLLHGDLWSGNAAEANGRPVIYDPAVYFGDREFDIAMTELFGRFPNAFYNSYNAEWPLDPGYELRKPLYQLYHVLNHFNLFGGGYSQQAEQLTRELLANI
jgi:protein-ribulosamine 3-kinase